MAKSQSTEARLARLRELRGQPSSPELVKELRNALLHALNHVVAEAAEMAGTLHVSELSGDLAAAYERFLDQPAKKDKMCRAKIAIIEALNNLEYTNEEFYLAGIRYVQPEPVWGGSIDTAVPVRVASAFGLVRSRHRGVLPLLVELLVDSEKAARVGAAQALTYSSTEAAGLLLRLKARIGDPEPEVVSECLTGILELSAADGVPFVASFLDSADEAIQEAALLALGSSRRAEAFELLKAFADRNRGDLQDAAHVALALLRLPAATDFLLSLVSSPSPDVAASAVGALAVHRYDPRVKEKVAAAVGQKNDATLRALFEKRFEITAGRCL